MLKTVRRAANVFQRKPSLRHCGASIMPSVLRPKLVYALTFSKTPASVVYALEGAFGVSCAIHFLLQKAFLGTFWLERQSTKVLSTAG